MNYIITDREENTVAVSTVSQADACEQAREIRPNEVLFGTIRDAEGNEKGGFLVGQLPADFGM